MKTKQTIFLYSIFATTIFLGAFLLFQVQPIIGKYILPWFGGTSFVWITALLFFQTLLLAGYFYAFLMSKLPVKRQIIVHSLIIFLAVLSIVLFFSTRPSPITPTLAEKLPDTVSPFIQVTVILLISVGLPYFLLSTTSTLLQKWFSSFPHKKSPYSLYAISNVGSLLGIVSYPFLIEPLLSIQKQGFIWSIIFLGLCLLLFFCSGYMLLQQTKEKKEAVHTKEKPTIVTKQQAWLWFGLSATSSLMLLAATHQMTQGIAPIPFLWLLPLGLYLVSFILCFSDKKLYAQTFWGYVYLAILLIILTLLLQPIVISVVVQVLLYGILIFACFMLCHGELYALRPSPNHLNAFYLLIAFGSVIGASIVAIIAPLFFKGLFWEFYLGLYATSLIAAFTLASNKQSAFVKLLDKAHLLKKELPFFLFFVCTGTFFVLGILSYMAQTRSVVGIWRNFYGTQRVNQQQTSLGKFTCLLNGKIIHGCQFADKKLKLKPVTYYGPNSGLTLAVASVRARNKQLNIGVIGLGVGTIAAYGKKGDTITFYELNPQDIEIAQTQFSYLKDSQATIKTIAGDGRLSLAKDFYTKGSAKDTLLVIDAFNDDAIPVHLLTKEAFDLYRKNLDISNSIIAVNISTNYLDLAPVIVQLSKHFGMHAVIINSLSEGPGLTASRWALLSADPALLETKTITKKKQDLSNVKQVQLWTDDYSNVFQLLK